MLEPERLEMVLGLLKQRRIASTQEICGITGASEATVRRDLSKLEDEALIRRVHGGAELISEAATENQSYGELPLAHRKSYRQKEKENIARYAAGLCRKDETVIIDGGSTTLHMAEHLREAGCRVITNSFAIAEYLLHRSNNQVIIPGGIIYKNSELILDPFQGEFYRNYAATKVFMGAGGIGAEGLTNNDPELIRVERLMINQGRELIILGDSSKFDLTGPLFLCGLEAISTLITDTDIKSEQRGMLEAAGVNIVTV